MTTNIVVHCQLASELAQLLTSQPAKLEDTPAAASYASIAPCAILAVKRGECRLGPAKWPKNAAT